jgi:HD-GYP domain-containing protein (c-di-GMP phosphodiesterase class II)
VNESDSAEWLEIELNKEQFSWVEPILLSEDELEDAIPAEEQAKKQLETEVDHSEEKDREQDKKRKALQAYGYALNSLQEVSQKVSTDKRASIKKALRMVHIMIDTVMDDNNVLLSLSTIRDYDDYTFTHSLNVAILSMCLGQRIGLSKSLLETLSLSAMFHDLGKIDVPKKILNKPGKLSEQEFKEMRNHSIYSVRQIILLKASQKRRAAMMLPPFEHHLKYDLSGYPQTPRKKPLSLFGRIICIADVFDAITAKRIYRSFPISPDRALGIMQEGSGKDFDPVLLKVFINMIGVYPIGTLLKLDKDEMGLVAKYGGESGNEKELWVQLLIPQEQGGFTKGELLNLGPLNEETKSFNRPVMESLHPAAFNIQPADFIL